jgi:hypothetical protein
MIAMTQSYREGVGCMVRLRYGVETKYELHHFLYLGFVSSSFAQDGLFNLQGAVFMARYVPLCQTHEYHSPGLGYGHCCFNVLGKEDALQSGFLRIKLI